MNQVETWFSILTRDLLQRGSDESVRALVARIGYLAQDGDEEYIVPLLVAQAEREAAEYARWSRDFSADDPYQP